jgi:hydroxymethylglutaryl-CoA reductase
MNMAQTDRDILFSNEAFVIGILQAVSGGALVAAIAQSEALIKLSGNIAFLLFLTAMAVSLLVAVLAAYWKHQYKLWDVKAQVSAAQNAAEEAQTRSVKANRYLKVMRAALIVSLLGVLFGVGELVVAFWFRALCVA